MEEPYQIPEGIKPRFNIPVTSYSRRLCVFCRKSETVYDFHDTRFRRCSRCKICVYCSKECQRKDFKFHKYFCKVITDTHIKILHHISESALYFGEEEVMEAIDNQNLLQFGCPWDAQDTRIRFFDYFLLRHTLIDVLLKEAFGRKGAGDVRINELAIDVAILHYNDLFKLDKFDTNCFLGLPSKKAQLMNLYLHTGRLQECYDLCKFYAREGRVYYPYVSDEFQDNVVLPDMENEDVAEFCSAIELNNESFPWDALNHLYLTKYLLHMNMEKLIFLNDQFLDNRDCTSIIGEFLGMKKEWLIYTKDWYRHQALQILYTFAKGDATSKLFSDINEAPFVVSREIEAAKRIGMLQFKEIEFKCNCCSDIGKYLAWKVEEHPAALKSKLDSWLQTQKYCETDLDYYLMDGIDLIFEIAIEKLNEISGCTVFEDTWTNLNGEFKIDESRVTFFAVHIMQMCHDNFFSLNEFLNEMDRMSWQPSFSRSLFQCLVLERKIAQINFYINMIQHPSAVKEVLALIPHGKELFRCHPPLSDTEMFCIIDDNTLHADSDKIDFVATWKSDVTMIVDALFENKCATENNLKVLFGDDKLVANRIWQLKLKEKEKGQKTITDFMSLEKTWKEGCTVHDTLSGFTIHYLTKEERRQELENADDFTKIMAGECVEDSLYPPPSDFEENFRWKCDGYESAQECFDNDYEDGDFTERERLEIFKELNEKVCGWELLGFKSMEEAYRHNYDAGSLEEAIWDSVGIPRLIALNGDKKTVMKSGWKYLGYKPGKDYELGDRSLRLGSRIVFASCGVYEERKPARKYEKRKRPRRFIDVFNL